MSKHIDLAKQIQHQPFVCHGVGKSIRPFRISPYLANLNGAAAAAAAADDDTSSFPRFGPRPGPDAEAAVLFVVVAGPVIAADAVTTVLLLLLHFALLQLLMLVSSDTELV